MSTRDEARIDGLVEDAATLSVLHEEVTRRAHAYKARAEAAESRVADLEAGIRALIQGWSKGADRAADLGDFGRAASYGPFIDSLRALVGDETPGTGEHA